MTTTDIITRITAAIRNSDHADLEFLAEFVDGMIAEDDAKFAFRNLIEAVSEIIEESDE